MAFLLPFYVALYMLFNSGGEPIVLLVGVYLLIGLVCRP